MKLRLICTLPHDSSKYMRGLGFLGEVEYARMAMTIEVHTPLREEAARKI